MRRNRVSILAGILLIALGAWFLAEQLGVPLPELRALWPAILLALGLFSIADYFLGGRADSGKIWFGVVATLVGAFFFLFTLGRLTWNEDMRRYWPVFILIVSAAFFIQWLFDPARRRLLIPASITLLVGGFFLAFSLNLFGPEITRQIVALWPVALILLGALVLLRAVMRRQA